MMKNTKIGTKIKELYLPSRLKMKCKKKQQNQTNKRLIKIKCEKHENNKKTNDKKYMHAKNINKQTARLK